MNLIGKATINPILFYSGKISGYITWIIYLLLIFKIDFIDRGTYIYNDYISYIILIIGLLFSILSIINLGSSTRLGLPSEDTVFKTNGLYKLSRNPMYLGFNLVTISSMIYTYNILIILLGIYSILVYHLIILGEEKFLQTRFGEKYIDYKRKTGRYL
jgi:protein-S-isoprenylcysteine O-methyltransferase Ste14